LSCADVTELTKAIHKAQSSEEAHAGLLPSVDSTSAKRIFQDYLKEKSIEESDPIAMHLRTLFEAGIHATRLEISELLRHTSERLFSWNSFLRASLGLFIVFGLLGTLVGLAESLISFSQPLQTSTKAWSNDQVRLSITTLLMQLRGAFTPSIVGVALTIIGVLIFNLYLKFVCLPTQLLLDHLTISAWIPQLIPTTPQRFVETLERSEEQMRQSFMAAEKVADFAKEIQNESGEFNTNLKTSNKALKQLGEVGIILSGFAKTFADATTKLTSFQEELRSLYKESLSNSNTVRDNVSASLRDAQAFHSGISEHLHNQGTQLQVVVSSLKSYETSYVSRREQLDTALRELVAGVNQTLGQIESRNTELIEKFGSPLIEQLQRGFLSIENSLKVDLSLIHSQFDRLNAPMNEASVRIEGVVETFDKRTINLIEKLERDFIQREDLVRQELKNLKDLSTKIVSLLVEIATPTQDEPKSMLPQTPPIDNIQSGPSSRRDGGFKKIPEGEETKLDREMAVWSRRLLAAINWAFRRGEKGESQKKMPE
jgi:uncharacterized phage infection (PIP) family protein YhgE